MNSAQFKTTALQAWDVQTPWTLLLDEIDKTPHSMEKLLALYSSPVYAFYRKEGLSSADAEDLTQQLLMSFFLIRKSHLNTQPTKGRFRDYLLTAARNVLLDWRKGARAKKREGTKPTLSLSELKWDDHVWEPAGGTTPNEEFERQWARTTWAAALEIFRQREPGELTATLEVYYQGEAKTSQEEAARKLNVSVACFNSRLHRARKSLHEILLNVIRSTVENEADAEEEMACLRDLLSRCRMSMPPPRSSQWRLDQLASDMNPNAAPGAANEWPHPDYAAAAAACRSSPDDRNKLLSLCDDLESLVTLGSGWASLERIARTNSETCSRLRGKCWREILQQTDLGDDVWKTIYRLGSAYRAESMDSATRRTAMILQLVARQRLKAAAGLFENADESTPLESERAQLLTRPYLPAFLRDALS